jgi:hypothetical protein
MSEEPTPTYRVEKEEDVTLYTCLVGDAGRPDGICGHEASDLDLFTQHMAQRHAGLMVVEPAPKGDRPAQAAVRQARAQVAEKQGDTAGAKE